MGKNRSAWTPKDAQPVEVSVSLTRTCIARGATFIPQKHADDLPAGPLTLVDKKNEYELQVEYAHPRELRGFDDYFQHLDLQPNDIMLVRVFPDGRGELEFRTRPRRQAAPSAAAPVVEGREPEAHEERPTFLDWRPDPFEGAFAAPTERAALQPLEADLPVARRESGDEEPTEVKPAQCARARVTEQAIKERLSKGRDWFKGWLQRERPADEPEAVEKPLFTPRPEFAAPATAPISIPHETVVRPAPQPGAARRETSVAAPAWDESSAWESERLTTREGPILAPEPQRASPPPPATVASAPAAQTAPPTPDPAAAQRAPTVALIEDTDFPDPELPEGYSSGEPVIELLPAAQAPAPTAARAVEPAAAPEPEPEPEPDPEPVPLTPLETLPPESSPEQPAEELPEEPVVPAGGDLEPLRRMREYLARPGTPVIVRVDDAAKALALKRESAGSLLDHIAGEPETNVTRIKPGAYMVRRTA